MGKHFSDKNLSTEELERVADAGFDRLDSLYALRSFSFLQRCSRLSAFLFFCTKRMFMLPVLCIVVFISVVADAYLFALKKVRGSILFPETY